MFFFSINDLQLNRRVYRHVWNGVIFERERSFVCKECFVPSEGKIIQVPRCDFRLVGCHFYSLGSRPSPFVPICTIYKRMRCTVLEPLSGYRMRLDIYTCVNGEGLEPRLPFLIVRTSYFPVRKHIRIDHDISVRTVGVAGRRTAALCTKLALPLYRRGGGCV